MSDDVLRLSWDDASSVDRLRGVLAALDAAGGPVSRRVEVAVASPSPRGVRTLLHQHGFRLEGRSRQSRQTASGPADVLHYSRLADDPAEGRERFTAVMNSVTPRKRLIAHALVTDAGGRVLLCETSFKADFELPGGIVEPFESPRVGLVRELTEEIGRPLAVGRVLVLDWLPPYLGWEDALELIFDAGMLDADAAAGLVPDGAEIVALHWLEPDAAASAMTPIAGRHLRAALKAREAGESVYLEAGDVISA